MQRNNIHNVVINKKQTVCISGLYKLGKTFMTSAIDTDNFKI